MNKPFKDHFSSRAASYAAFRPDYPPELTDHLASLTVRRDLALDCGCGSGQLSVLLASRFQRVVAIDASAEQIASARPHDRVAYRVARAENPDLPDASADLITAAQAAHWFDLPLFYTEVRRVLRPGGALALLTYGAVEIDGEPAKALARFHREVVGPYWPPETRHVATAYRSLPFPFHEEAPPVLSIQKEWSVDELLGYVDTWSAVRNAEAALGREPFHRFNEDLRAAWGDVARREVRWPLHMRIGRL